MNIGQQFQTNGPTVAASLFNFVNVVKHQVQGAALRIEEAGEYFPPRIGRRFRVCLRMGLDCYTVHINRVIAGD